MIDVILKFNPKSSPISIVNVKQESKMIANLKIESKRIKEMQETMHHQKQLLDEDDGLRTKKQRHKQKQIKCVTKLNIQD